MIGSVAFKQLHVLVNCIDKPDMFSQLEHRGDTAIVDGVCSIGEFILDSIGANDRVRVLAATSESIGSGCSKSFENLLLAFDDPICETCVHLNSSCGTPEWLLDFSSDGNMLEQFFKLRNGV